MSEKTSKIDPSEMLVLLTTAADTPRAKAVLDFALAHGLSDPVLLPTHSPEMKTGVDLAAAIYIRASILADKFTPSVNGESILVDAILLALLDRASQSTWSFGAELLYEVRAAGIQISREEVGALLAQEGTYATNRSKGELMKSTPLAVLLYCGRFQARLCGCSFKMTAPDGEATGNVQFPSEPMDRILSALNAYVKKAVGPENENRFLAFVAFLEQSTFPQDPASTKYHLAEPGGLALHTSNVLSVMTEILSPVTSTQMAKITLAAVCHDLCKVGVYKPTVKSQKIDGKWVEVNGYSFEDPMPFGHGRKSMYMAVGYFGKALGEDVAKAIDGHMADSPNTESQFADFPLGVALHIADVIATYILEK